ncbi:hypothetical protein JL12_08705 [Gallibacterium anatis 10672-6]|uniref:hypothetical protein n=1 Tax=Gallibacterium anatis TaxID=750 RepID=UPI0005316CDC|nr:hypothetical protein [Gallibacterium anatis]KGQ48628.1 hypothetical protein JL12_08705 [Gallibacterium anatis 10672-6]
MGQIIRLNTVFTNKKLPTFLDRDVSMLEAELRAHPNLQAFWDFSDLDALKLSGEKIVQVTDKSTFARHLQTDAGVAPSINRTLLGGIPSAHFDGASAMESVDNVLNARWNKLTYVAFLIKTEVTTTNTIAMVGNTNAYVSLYISNSDIAANSGALRLKQPVIGTPLDIITSYDFKEAKSGIITPEGSSFEQGAKRTLTDNKLYVGKWSDGANPDHGQNFKGYIGHLMVFNDYIANDPLMTDILQEYSRRKYGTPMWEL